MDPITDVGGSMIRDPGGRPATAAEVKAQVAGVAATVNLAADASDWGTLAGAYTRPFFQLNVSTFCRLCRVASVSQ